MKGIVFVKLNEFVEQTWGLACWESLLAATDLPSGGIYTSVMTYDDNEIFALIDAISKQKSLHPFEAQKTFGQWLFKELYAIAPAGVHQFNDVFGFLRAVQDVIHVEVKKLNPDVLLPEFEFLEETDTALTFEYRSPRKMNYFCEGLILGLAEYVDQTITVTHLLCEHKGDKKSVIRVDKC
ncbi:4-vinyl reductase [Alteromonas sediminis]|uniref:4-vinyl reductase n=1 Tax=Alteromonas sediminis TaxID=2259342 RepID=A0A3N5Y1V8_9ALTE|nr:heme NO-binding domain-containing protein [Alteromonas sediminis]RPJ67230.1 4-vinyl reductase [Alteromonas sediminis]